MSLIPINLLTLKWTIPIMLITLESKHIRFGEIKKSLEGITSARLSSTLKEMEKHNIIKKHIFDNSSKMTIYSLSEEGKEFMKTIKPFLIF